MKPTIREQKLVDIMFEMIISAVDTSWFKTATRNDVAEWGADTLQKNGFPTHSSGLSWGVLDDIELFYSNQS